MSKPRLAVEQEVDAKSDRRWLLAHPRLTKLNDDLIDRWNKTLDNKARFEIENQLLRLGMRMYANGPDITAENDAELREAWGLVRQDISFERKC